MCLILLAHRVHPGYPLVFAANRDEFYDRPTAAAEFWPDATQVLAGRDLRAGGTWMGVTRQGRWAAVTNYRDPPVARPAGPSRGGLVAEFLSGESSAADYASEVTQRAKEYDGFNLLVGDAEAMFYFGNRDGRLRPLPAGIYGLSNHLLDTPWPKVKRGKRALAALLAGGDRLGPEALFALLYDTEIAPREELPDTGIGDEWERVLSASFIATAAYGTRSSTALLIDRAGMVTFVERSFLPGPVPASEVRHEFAIETKRVIVHPDPT
jgi:uncharacterized protein with NRDE domain